MATETKTSPRMNGKAISARSEAVKRLVEAHAEEFGTLLVEERTSRGLAPESGGESTRELEERLRKYEEKAAKMKETLAARGVSTDEK